jgi:cyclomaltodextrinase / maltogenic alpha-amylase / neopullulanase
MKQIIIPIAAIFVIAMCIFFVACTNKKQVKPLPPPSEVKHIDWSKNAVIYEANVRQYSPEGTFNSFTKDLPRLKELGIDIIWVMPINPIGEVKRKGKLGSYYSVKDYKAINPEYGNMDDFKNMVNEVHKLGMHILIDWVPNHSSWDNVIFKEHPEYYLKDTSGRFVSPFDWTDVVRFNYKNPGMRQWMIETMKFWLTETGIDGFRCDVAHMVPVEFWDSCRMELDKVKPIFFLAEADQPELHAKAYDMSYDWKFHHIMNQIAKGKKTANAIEKHFAWVDSIYPAGSILMEFTSNHDENSWNGTEFERMDGGAQTFAVLAATVPGMLLIYNGQEAAFNKRLRFFEKDTIQWGNYIYTDFYKRLIDLKKKNQALWNGYDGGSFERIETTDSKSIYAFTRKLGDNQISVILNLTKKQRTIALMSELADGDYIDAYTGQQVSLKKFQKLVLAPWQYMLLVKK